MRWLRDRPYFAYGSEWGPVPAGCRTGWPRASTGTTAVLVPLGRDNRTGDAMSLVGFRASNHPQQVGKRGATDRDNLGTDPALFDKLDERFHFTLDVCATTENAKCEQFFTAEQDGLVQRWADNRVWCNPPYSDIRPWIEKAWWEADTTELIVMLLPANRTEQAWWQDCVEPLRRAAIGDFTVEFLRGRQRFVLPGAESIGPNERPPFGCCLLIWEPPS